MKKIIFILLMSVGVFAQNLDWSDVDVNFPTSKDDTVSTIYATAADTIRASNFNEILRILRLLEDKIGLGVDTPGAATEVLIMNAGADSTVWRVLVDGDIPNTITITKLDYVLDDTTGWNTTETKLAFVLDDTTGWNTTETKLAFVLDDTTNWNTAYGWGDWSTEVGYIADDTTGWNTTETKIAFILDDTTGWNTTETKLAYVLDDTTNWQTAYGWGDWSTAVGYIADDTTGWNTTETKLAFVLDDTTTWNALVSHVPDTLTWNWGIMDTVVTGDLPGWKVPFAITIVKVSTYTDANTTTFNLEERAAATPNTAGTDMFGTDMVAVNTSLDSTSFTNAGFAKDTWMVPNISATGDVAIWSVTVRYIKQ